jgi:hypothetical protein
MKKLFLTLLLATLCSTAYGQTIKALGYNTTNNRIIGPTNTNALVFTNVTSFEVDAFFNGGDIRIGGGSLDFGGNERINLEENRFAGEWTFDQPASWRTNLGLGATWLTNDNVTNFRTAIELGETNLVTFGNVAAGSPSPEVEFGGSQAVVFFYDADGGKDFFFFDNGAGGADEARARTNLGLGATNDVTFNSVAVTNAALTRTNLGLGTTDNVEFGSVVTLSVSDEFFSSAIEFANDTLKLFADSEISIENNAVFQTNVKIDGLVDFSTNHTNTSPATNSIDKFLEIRIGTNQYWMPLYK